VFDLERLGSMHSEDIVVASQVVVGDPSKDHNIEKKRITSDQPHLELGTLDLNDFIGSDSRDRINAPPDMFREDRKVSQSIVFAK
jgi:hypothetical protein